MNFTICLHPWSIRFSKLLWVLLTEVRITKHHESAMVLWIPDIGKVVVGPCKHVTYDRCPGTCLLDNTTLTLSFWWSLCAADSLGSSCTDDLAIEGWKKLLSCLWSVQLQMTAPAPVHLLEGATLQYCQEWTVIIRSTGLHWERNPWYIPDFSWYTCSRERSAGGTDPMSKVPTRTKICMLNKIQVSDSSILEETICQLAWYFFLKIWFMRRGKHI